MIAPSARMMLLGAPYAGQRLRKLRFLTTDNSWCKDFGSFKICGSGSYPKTFLLRGQVGKGAAL